VGYFVQDFLLGSIGWGGGLGLGFWHLPPLWGRQSGDASIRAGISVVRLECSNIHNCSQIFSKGRMGYFIKKLQYSPSGLGPALLFPLDRIPCTKRQNQPWSKLLLPVLTVVCSLILPVGSSIVIIRLEGVEASLTSGRRVTIALTQLRHSKLARSAQLRRGAAESRNNPV